MAIEGMEREERGGALDGVEGAVDGQTAMRTRRRHSTIQNSAQLFAMGRSGLLRLALFAALLALLRPVAVAAQPACPVAAGAYDPKKDYFPDKVKPSGCLNWELGGR